MRISDWSSDVCSSDLGDPRSAAARLPTPTGFPAPPHRPQAPSGARRNPGAGLLSAGVPLPGAAAGAARLVAGAAPRSEEHTSELQSLMRSSYAVFCLKKKKEEETASDETPDKEPDTE